eukprot:1138244-Pelagomonas_calceolata.AAC.2
MMQNDEGKPLQPQASRKKVLSCASMRQTSATHQGVCVCERARQGSAHKRHQGLKRLQDKNVQAVVSYSSKAKKAGKPEPPECQLQHPHLQLRSHSI